MTYTESTLAPSEQIVYRSRLHWSIWWGPLFWGLVISIVTMGLGLLLAVPWWLWTWCVWQASEFSVTTARVVLKVGILKRRTLEMVLNRVESVSVDQGYGGRLFGYGTVIVVGTGGSREPFTGIDHPLAFRAAVMTRLATDSVHTPGPLDAVRHPAPSLPAPESP